MLVCGFGNCNGTRRGNGGGDNLPVNNVRDAVVENRVGICDACVVHPSGAVRKDSEDEIIALERFDCNVAQGRGEDDVVRDDVVLEDFLEGSLISGCDDGADVLEGLVGGHEYGEVREVQSVVVCAGEAKVDVQAGGFEGAVEAEVAGAVGEELERGAEGEYGVDFVDGYTLAEFDVCLCNGGNSLFSRNNAHIVPIPYQLIILPTREI